LQIILCDRTWRSTSCCTRPRSIDGTDKATCTKPITGALGFEKNTIKEEFEDRKKELASEELKNEESSSCRVAVLA
jgi:hypothetical protein